MVNNTNNKTIIFHNQDIERAERATRKLIYLMGTSSDLTNDDADFIQGLIERVEMVTDLLLSRYHTPLIGMESDVIDLTKD